MLRDQQISEIKVQDRQELYLESKEDTMRATEKVYVDHNVKSIDQDDGNFDVQKDCTMEENK